MELEYLCSREYHTGRLLTNGLLSLPPLNNSLIILHVRLYGSLLLTSDSESVNNMSLVLSW